MNDLDTPTRVRAALVLGRTPCPELRGSRVMLLVIQTKHAMFEVARTRLVYN